LNTWRSILVVVFKVADNGLQIAEGGELEV